MIENWEDAAFETDGRVTTFRTEHLEITFTGTGIEGGCPAERDNDGCYVCEDGGVTLAPSKVFFAAYTPPQKTDGILSGRARRELGETYKEPAETSSLLVLYSLVLKRTEARTAAVPSGFLMARRQRFPSSFL